MLRKLTQHQQMTRHSGPDSESRGAHCSRHPSAATPPEKQQRLTSRKATPAQDTEEAAQSLLASQLEAHIHDLADLHSTGLLKPHPAYTPDTTSLPAARAHLRKHFAVALDCEMVGVAGNRSELARLGVVDALTGATLLDVYVRPREAVWNWRTPTSGSSWWRCCARLSAATSCCAGGGRRAPRCSGSWTPTRSLLVTMSDTTCMCCASARVGLWTRPC